MALLEVEDLHTEFRTDEGVVEAVNGVDLEVAAGETVGLVGESGSGKSVTALSILGLVDRPGRITEGRVEFHGEDLRAASERRLRELRGDELSMIFQDPMESLNPVLRIGDQIAETLRAHRKVPGEDVGWLESNLLGNFVPRRSARARYPESWTQAVELMDRVGIPEPEQRATEYPHQFSGGMAQRAMIAMALSCEPDLLIADEPTTALDVTIEAQILDTLGQLQDDYGMGVLLITHDLGVVMETCDRVAVMYAGEIVETGSVESVFADPAHPYTRALLDSIPRGRKGEENLEAIPGQVPDLVDPPEACFFEPRCPYAHESCRTGRPVMYEVGPNHEARCVLYDSTDPYGPGVLESEGLSVGGDTEATDATTDGGERDQTTDGHDPPEGGGS
ncbi:ABC transporter ATP-binding protein [Halorussus salinisoli]|uniref:ABC transporter ATP-binding protein n=1 Tax=Halorussus salinisoli TaxID=2558242 RepID=UPI002A914E10|nr:ABC transporter ATP-binding protein [Halorussus salinisoli]